MAEGTKIDFRCRRVRQIGDITDVLAMLFPGNRNQQHAAGRILMALKDSVGLRQSLTDLEGRFGISRRTLQRARSKLSRLGLIEHVTWMNSRHGGQTGWKLSGQMSSSLRLLADKLDRWRKDDRPDRSTKDEQLIGLLN